MHLLRWFDFQIARSCHDFVEGHRVHQGDFQRCPIVNHRFQRITLLESPHRRARAFALLSLNFLGKARLMAEWVLV